MLPETEILYRRILDSPDFIKEDGTLSSAGFKCTNGGLSVDRKAGRRLEDCLKFILTGYPDNRVASISVKSCQCDKAHAVVKHMPIEDINPYHSEIHGSNTKVKLTDGQSRALARMATLEN